MIRIRRAEERGHTRTSWLDSRHTFAFGSYVDPAHLGFRSLRVINEDRVAPGQGFATHGHRDMEIVTYVLSGVLAHRDSLGTGSEIRPGEVQRMSAGTGITHSEFNVSGSESVHFLQIWILPEEAGLTPSYEQRAFPESERRGTLRLVASREGREGSLRVHQDASVFATSLSAGEKLTHALAPGRHAWVQVARGGILLNGETLAAGDGAALSETREIELRAREASELLVFDLG
ncbi:MAG TPA: pirin family protein [Myxococcota bacterium]|nr:pirin family protein [Myxococcota bacterium]